VCTTDKPAGGPDAPPGKKLQPSIKEQRTTQQQNSKEIPNLKRGGFRREIIAHFHSQNVQRIIREILESIHCYERNVWPTRRSSATRSETTALLLGSNFRRRRPFSLPKSPYWFASGDARAARQVPVQP
jgi:hypothetical protein